jgi:hypothetical protein
MSRFTPGAMTSRVSTNSKKSSRVRDPKIPRWTRAQRRGLETAPTDEAEKGRAKRNAQRNPESRREASGSDPVARFKAAQKEFIAGIADFDPRARERTAELREEMKWASQEIAKRPSPHTHRGGRRHRPPGQKLRASDRTRANTSEAQGCREGRRT